jgi:3-oxoacyl-[acyl-carrier protein] reductase
MQKIKELVHHAKPSKSSTTEESTTQTSPALDAQDMSPILAGKVALITGGSKGIGKATALALHKLGAKVVVNYGRDSAAANTFVKELGGEANALAVRADAGSMSGVEKLVTEATVRYGKIDILIPNAGLLAMKTVSQTTEEDFDHSFNLNVKGPYFLVQKAIPYMGPGSSIVLISTTQCTASTVSAPYTLYNATKGAIEQMTRTISKDLASKGINVNCVSPGPTGTDLFLDGKPEQVLKTIASLNPHNRIGEPEEVADAIVFLCTPSARWISGQNLRVNGGQA